MAGGAHEHSIQDVNGLEEAFSRLDAMMSDLDGSWQERFDRLQASLDAYAPEHERQLQAVRDRIAALEKLINGGGSVWTPKFAGDVPVGVSRWGAAVGGNADPVARHENFTNPKTPMGVRRTFWDMSKTTSLVNTVKADHTAGRLPWVSVKLGTSWQNVANGSIDAALTKLFNDLKATGKPVWFTAHHEPEGGNGTAFPDDGQGTEIHWRNMQIRIRNILNATGAKNIAFAPILMSWTWDSRSGRNPADWWVDGIWDFAGIDHYKTVETGEMKDLPAWVACEAFYKSKGLRIGIGEWGNRGTGAAAATQMTNWYNHLASIGSPGICYFDSGLNSPSGSWELLGDPLTRFRQLMVETYPKVPSL